MAKSQMMGAVLLPNDLFEAFGKRNQGCFAPTRKGTKYVR